MGSGLPSTTEDRALSLLGNGVPAANVAAALGVTESRISQLLSQAVFAEKVAELRYTNLQSYNARDSKYDNLEDRLIEKLDKSLAFMIRPGDILKAIQVVNNAKRRGQSAPEQVTNQQNLVNIVLPSVITQKFVVNMNNQVTKAGNQELLTLASGNLLKQVEEAQNETNSAPPIDGEV